MDIKVFPAFIDEAMRLLPEIRNDLLLSSQNGYADPHLARHIESVTTVAENALMLGLSEVASVSRSLETELSLAVNTANGVAIDTNRPLDLLVGLEAALLKISLDDEDFSLDIDDFIDESFGLLQKNDLAASVAESEPFALDVGTEIHEAAPADEFEIDAELLEIFSEEAEGLLKNIDESLELLAGDPANSDALWEIRRNAHTFKGSAGIVGLKTLSEVAHRVEDLLDKLAEAKQSSHAGIFELLRTSSELLKGLLDPANAAELASKITSLYQAFDTLLANLASDASQAALATQTEIVEGPAVQQQTDPLDIALELPAVVGSIEEDTRPTEKVFAVVQDGHPAAAKPQAARSIVRVSLNRLDELVTIVRDMIISRSVFEQRLKELEHQIDELHNATRRLQSTNTKLELDFEASMLAADSTSMFGPGQSPQISASAKQYGFDDLEFDQYTDFHQSTRELAETTSDTFAISTSLDSLRSNFESLFESQRHLVENLQDKLMRIRMVEFGSLSTRLQRAVRVTCEEEFKKAQIGIRNEKLEIDTQILDALIEPLMHLLKNAVVHGIEQPEVRRLLGKPEVGLIEISVANEETHIVLEVSDDGRGISPSHLKEKAISLGAITREAGDEMSDDELLDLIFVPGLTTAERLNLNAGRGVGMSIVKESIEAKKGTVVIESKPQKGTVFTVRMPLTLAVTNILLVRVGHQTFAIPLRQIKHVCEVTDENLIDGVRGEDLVIGTKKYPLVRLDSYLNSATDQSGSQIGMNALLVEFADRSFALSVDEVLRSEEVVIKPLGRPLENLKGMLGAAVLGNGELAAIIDLPSFLKRKRKRQRSLPESIAAPALSVMIVDDSPSIRHLTSKLITQAGWTPLTAKDGIDALEQLKTMAALPAVILTDIEMPRMDGYEFTASLQRTGEFSKIPVIMITSRSAEKHRSKGFENGISKYLSKPFDEKELIDSIRELAAVTA